MRIDEELPDAAARTRLPLAGSLGHPLDGEGRGGAKPIARERVSTVVHGQGSIWHVAGLHDGRLKSKPTDEHRFGHDRRDVPLDRLAEMQNALEVVPDLPGQKG
jgi:hypothetical protein